MIKSGNKLRPKEEFSIGLFINSPIGMYVVQDGIFKLVNPTFQNLTGFGADELVGKNPLEIVAREDRTLVRESAIQMLKGYRFFPYEYRAIAKNGNLMWVVETVTTIKYEGKRASLGYYMDITEQKRIEEALRSSREELRNLTLHMETVREEERSSIAREVHDELGQALTALKIDVSWLSNGLLKNQVSLLEKTKSMSKLIDETIKTIQRISTKLRPMLLDDLGLTAAIEWQAEEFQKRTGIECEMEIDHDYLTLGTDISTAIFRIFQETLTNIVRHAKATKAKVSLKEKAGKLIMRVRDNGKGITKKEIFYPRSFGLIGIRERAHFLGGEVTIHATPGRGSTVTVGIPLQKAGKSR